MMTSDSSYAPNYLRDYDIAYQDDPLYSVSCATPQLRYIAYALAGLIAAIVIGVVTIRQLDRLRPW